MVFVMILSNVTFEGEGTWEILLAIFTVEFSVNLSAIVKLVLNCKKLNQLKT